MVSSPNLMHTVERNLALEAVRVTEAAALSASLWVGRGDEKAADQAAVDAMRLTLNSLALAGTVVIGEGERDEAPMLYIGEEVGRGGPEIPSISTRRHRPADTSVDAPRTSPPGRGSSRKDAGCALRISVC